MTTRPEEPNAADPKPRAEHPSGPRPISGPLRATEPDRYVDHPLSPSQMDPEAVKIIHRLQRHGFDAYLVGGCVRDLVLGVPPKDFDVATSATPRQIKALFRNCRVIGRRFRLCHIFFKDKIIEVATFRADPLAKLEANRGGDRLLSPPDAAAEGKDESTPEPQDDDALAPWEQDEESAAREAEAVHGRGVRAREELAQAVAEQSDSKADLPRRRRRRRRRRLLDEPPPQGYGEASEDARLRDFTVNALFYDPIADEVIDYVGGWRDLEARILRTIGDPDERLREDPVRILRAIKGSARGGLRIDALTRDAMVRQREHLTSCSPRRLLEEILKLLSSGAAAHAFRQMGAFGITRVLLPEVAHVYEAPGAPGLAYLEALDRAEPQQLDPALLIATLFYPVVCRGWELGGLGRPGAPVEHKRRTRLNETAAEVLVDNVLRGFAERRSLSRRARVIASRLILAQRALRRPRERRRRSARLIAREWFDDALRLLAICLEAEGADDEALRWWRERAQLVREAGDVEEDACSSEEKPRRKRRRRRGRRGGRLRRKRRRAAIRASDAGGAGVAGGADEAPTSDPQTNGLANGAPPENPAAPPSI